MNRKKDPGQAYTGLTHIVTKPVTNHTAQRDPFVTGYVLKVQTILQFWGKYDFEAISLLYLGRFSFMVIIIFNNSLDFVFGIWYYRIITS